MAKFQHALWGYELDYPDDWVHRTIQDAEGFAALEDALSPNYAGPGSGHLLIRAEGNWDCQDIEPLWSRHIGMVSAIINARQVGSASWKMGGGSGFEAEILLPKHENKRLWTGVLGNGPVLLKLMVTHPRQERESFEPVVTNVISSLRFLERTDGVKVTEDGLPIPPGWSAISPVEVVSDIAHPENWRAYQGIGQVGSMQVFFLREASHYGWEKKAFNPFPGPSELGFGRFLLCKDEISAMLGILPGGDSDYVNAESPARLVVKFTPGCRQE